MLGNYKYNELFDHGEGPPKPGMTYEEIIRSAVESGLIQDARSRPEAWIARAPRAASPSWRAGA